MIARNIVVIGASAGGVEALAQLVSQLPATLPAACFIVQHSGRTTNSQLTTILNQAGPLPASQALDGEQIEIGRIYLATPDYHLLLADGRTKLARGPYENLARPAIDALFRSAAANYTSRTIGVILTGMLNDGTAGLSAIKRCGGLTIAQEPADATYPDMPQSAIDAGVVDYRVALAEIGPLIDQLVRVPLSELAVAPSDIVREAQIAARVGSDVATEEQIGTLVPLSCPECGGPLWQIDDRVNRYRCHVGHGFSSTALLEAQESEIERGLWVALRTLEERARLINGLIGRQHNQSGGHMDAQRERQQELRQSIGVLRAMLEAQGWRQASLTEAEPAAHEAQS